MAQFARDQFNSPAGANLIGRAPDIGAAWVSHPYWGGGSPFVLADPAGYCQSGADVFTARMPTAPGNGFGQYDLDGILNAGFGNGVVLVGARCGTDVTGYFVRARENFGSPDLQIERMDAGVFNAGASASRTYTAWSSRKVLSIKLEDLGGGSLKISALVDGVEELSVTDASPIAGAGFAVIGGRGSYLYDFAASDTVAAGDTTAPTLSSPSGVGAVDACSGSVSTDEANGTLYVVFTDSASAPTAVQVEAGQNEGGGLALRAVSQAVTATGTQSIASGAISAGTRYAHFMHKDAAGNRSSVVSSASFTVTASGGGGGVRTPYFSYLIQPRG